MSYSIYIGQAVVVDSDGAFGAGGELRVSVQSESHPEAPTAPNDALTSNTNARHPGYSSWDAFVRAVGLRDLFFSEEYGLMREHPGCFAFTPEHLRRVRDALRVWRKKWPHASPGFMADGDHDTTPAKIAAAHLARLIWLEWWMGHALKTCPLPAIYNH